MASHSRDFSDIVSVADFFIAFVCQPSVESLVGFAKSLDTPAPSTQ
jgi:hypothetical protein